MITVLRKPSEVKNATVNVDIPCCGSCSGHIGPKDAPVIFVHNGCGMMFFHLDCAYKLSALIRERVKAKDDDCRKLTPRK